MAQPQAAPLSLPHAARRSIWPCLKEPLWVWGLTRLVFLGLTYFGVILFGSVLHGPHPSFSHRLLPAWNQWDTVWYTSIAARGYAWTKGITGPAAFFPLYPAAIRLVHVLTHRSYLVCALLVSNVAFLGALVYLWRLTVWELDRETAQRTLLYIAVFPTALFFFAGYNESLFLLFSAGCFFHLRRRSWLLAGLLGGLAAATRVTGVLLAVPFLYEYARTRNFSVREMVRPGVLGLLLIPAGLLGFMLYLQLAIGRPLAFLSYQQGWQKVFTPDPLAGMLESVRQIVLVQPMASFYQAHNLIELGVAILFLVATVLAARILPAAYTLYLAAFWLVTLVSPAMAGDYPVPLISLSRYVLALFPIFMYFGLRGRSPAWNQTYLVLSAAGLALLTVQFLNGGWVI